jgi:hypothetical protein
LLVGAMMVHVGLAPCGLPQLTFEMGLIRFVPGVSNGQD